MILYDLPAPAKLNLFLHVVGRRNDGYHLLQSLFRLITLSDSITVELRRDGLISREGPLCDFVPEDADLTLRAAKLLQQKTGSRLGAHIHVVKRIPHGAGLGGGSSDAATVLMALNRLWRTGLSRGQMQHMGLALGADVPFFLHGYSAFVEGVGEKLTTVRLGEQSYMVFKPNVGVATAHVFSDPDLTRDSKSITIMDFSGCANFVGSGTGQKAGFGKNDLEAVVLRKFSAVYQVKSWLRLQGIQARLSGSGSCLFAEAGSPVDAQLAIDELLAKMQSGKAVPGSQLDVPLEAAFVCDGLQQHPLVDWLCD